MNKTKFQRILCVIVACVLAFSVLTLPASANFTEVPDNFDHFLSSFRSYYQDYKSGNLTWGEFAERTLQETRKLGLNNITTINGYKDLISLLKSLGIDVDDFWTDFYYQRHGDDGSSGNRDEIMKGYGAVAIVEWIDRTGLSWFDFYYYGEYGVIDVCETGSFYFIYNGYYDTYSVTTGELRSSNNTFTSNNCYKPLSESSKTIRIYGDWRYKDGTSAADQTTEIPDDPTPGYDDPSITEDELEDFLEDLLDDLALQYPDLSTIEGILAALLAEMKTLDHDNDAGALTAISNAISQLSATNTADSEKIISALNNMSSGGNFDFEKLKSTLNEWIGLNGNYSEISKLEIVKDKFNKKIGFVSSFADLCGKVITAYTKTSSSVSFDISLYGETHTISFDWLEQYMPTFRIMLCAFIYISYAWRTYRKVPEYISGGGEDT